MTSKNKAHLGQSHVFFKWYCKARQWYHISSINSIRIFMIAFILLVRKDFTNFQHPNSFISLVTMNDTFLIIIPVAICKCMHLTIIKSIPLKFINACTQVLEFTIIIVYHFSIPICDRRADITWTRRADITWTRLIWT